MTRIADCGCASGELFALTTSRYRRSPAPFPDPALDDPLAAPGQRKIGLSW